MLADYKDIRDALNALRRDHHEEIAELRNFYPEGCTGEVGEMPNSPGAPKTPCACVVEPQWYDEHGVPRFAAHSPKLCPDIYAEEVALLEIQCQACGKEFHVQMSGNEIYERLRCAVSARRLGLSIKVSELPQGGNWALADQIRDGSIHYGDPPRHGGEGDGLVCSGDTMNCEDIQVLEFWERKSPSREWTRNPALEATLPDADADTKVEWSLPKEGPL